jgi:hypothetical protein
VWKLKTQNKANIALSVWSGFLFPHHFKEAASLPFTLFCSMSSCQIPQPDSSLEYIDDPDVWLRRLTDIDLATVTNPSARFEAITDAFLSSVDRGSQCREGERTAKSVMGGVRVSPQKPKAKRAKHNPPALVPTSRVTWANAPVPRASSALPSPRNSDLAAINNLLAADVTPAADASPVLAPSAVNIVPTHVLSTQLMPTLATVSLLHASAGSPVRSTPMASLPVNLVSTSSAPISLFQHFLNALVNMSS